MYMLKLLSDLETPVSTFMKLAQHEEHSFLLESTEHGSSLGRYSFIGVGAKDFLTLESDGELVSANGKVECARTPLSALPKWLEPHSFTLKSEELPPFVGGAVGYVGYDYIRYLEDVPAKVSIFPTFHFIVPAHLVIFDHLKSQIHVISEEPEEIAKKMRERLRVDITNTSVVTEPESNFKKVDFCEAVKKVKRYIVDGDAFQVVISQAFHFKTTLSPFSIYRALRVVNPSPYMFYLKSGEITVLGSSPETMVKLQDGAVTLKPIAGTRPRCETPEEDVRLEKELLSLFSGYQRLVPFDFTGYESRDRSSSIQAKDLPEARLTPQVSEFCSQKGISEYLKTALNIINESFPPVRILHLLKEQDPETEEQWLLIDITVDGSINDILEGYDHYVDQWVASAPESIRESIRLSYSVY